MPAKAFVQKSQLNKADFAALIRILIMSINYLQFSNHKLLYMACILYYIFLSVSKKSDSQTAAAKKNQLLPLYFVLKTVL